MSTISTTLLLGARRPNALWARMLSLFGSVPPSSVASPPAIAYHITVDHAGVMRHGTMLRVIRIPLLSLATRILLVLAIAITASCGGGGSSSSGAPAPVPAPSELSYPSPQTYPVGTAIAALNPSVTGTVTGYSVSPALPAGLTLNAANGQITGTPSALAETASYTITAQNSSGSTTFDLSIAIAGVDLLSGNVSRMVVSGTSVAVDASILPRNFAFSGTLFSTATDTDGVFMPAVSVTANDGGSYTLALTTSTTAAPGHYTGDATLNLCTDSACAARQLVPSIVVPFDINVMSPASAWPGDNLTVLSAWPGVPDWGTFQGNAAHTGYVPVDVNPNQFSTRWQTPAVALSGGFYQLLGTLTAADGQFFVAGNNVLYARSEFDGSPVWQYDFGGLQYPSVNPPAVANGVVYIAAGQQSSTFFFAFNAADGSLLFKVPMSSQWEHYLAPTIGANGIYTNAGTYGGLFAFDPSGLQLFFASMAQTSTWTPAVDATGVYTYTGGKLQVNDPTSGAVLSSISDPTFQNYTYEIGGSPVLGAAGSVFMANYGNSMLYGGEIGNTLTNFNLTTSAIAWQIPGAYPSTPAYAAGVLYVANENPRRLEARAEADGSLLWSWRPPPQSGDARFKSEVLLTNNLIFVSTDLSTYAIDVATHRTVWSYPLMGRLALSQNGILYIQGTDLLVAINLK